MPTGARSTPTASRTSWPLAAPSPAPTPTAPPSCLALALACWHGEAVAGFAGEPWALPEAVRLTELRLVTEEERIELLLDAGHHAGLVPELEALVGANPLRERLRGQLMIALYRSGRQAEALRSAQELRRHLGEHLGLEPSSELRQLEAAIAVDDPSPSRLTRQRPRPPATKDRPPRPPAAVPLAATSSSAATTTSTISSTPWRRPPC